MKHGLPKNSHNLFFHQNYAVYLMGIQVTVVFAKMGLSCIISNNLYFFVTIINDEKEKKKPLLSKFFIVFMSLDSTVCNSFFHKVLLQLLLKYDWICTFRFWTKYLNLVQCASCMFCYPNYIRLYFASRNAYYTLHSMHLLQKHSN